MFLREDENDLESISDKVTYLINCSVESVIPSKHIKVFPNNKPWVTREVKAAINRKKTEYLSCDKDKFIIPQRS